MFRNSLQNCCILMLLALVALPLYACEDTSAQAAIQAAPKTQVRYVVVGFQDIPLIQELPGRISPQTLAEVRPQVGGILEKRFFEEGSDVKAGQVLYQIDPKVYLAAYNSALASLKQAQANETSARLLAERYAVLVKTAAVSKQEHDDAVAASKQASATIDVAKAALETARISLDYTRVIAPVDGRIGRSFVTEGALLTAGQATLLATVQQLDPIYVDLTLSTTELLRVRKAFAQGEYVEGGPDSAAVHLYLEDGSLYTRLPRAGESEPEVINGTLLFSDVTVEQSTGTVTMRVKIDNPDSLLLPGMYVRAELEGGVAKNALAVPQKAVQRDNRGVFSAYVLNPQDGDYVVEQRTLGIDRNHGNNWVINSGLKGGDLLLVDGLQKVRTGQLVSAIAIENEQRNELAQGQASSATR